MKQRDPWLWKDEVLKVFPCVSRKTPRKGSLASRDLGKS